MLSSMLAKAFIIPISDEEIEELKQVVDSFLENISIDKLRLSGAVYFESHQRAERNQRHRPERYRRGACQT